jgi:hypothetical protein
MVDDKEVVRQVDGASAGAWLPRDPRVVIHQLGIGRMEWKDALTAPGMANSFGTIVAQPRVIGSVKYIKHDFGWAIENTSNTRMRVSIELVKVDKDGFVVERAHAGGDVGPGERVRHWAGLLITWKDEFAQYLINDIVAAPLGADGTPIPGAGFGHRGLKKGLVEIFDLDRRPLGLDRPRPRNMKGRVLLALAIFVVFAVAKWFAH